MAIKGTVSNSGWMRCLLFVLLMMTAGLAKEKTIPHAGTGLSFPPTIQAEGKVWTAITALPLSGAKLKSEGPFPVKGGPTQGLRAVDAVSGMGGGTPRRSELIQLLWRGFCVKVRPSGVGQNDTSAFLQAFHWPKKR